MQIDLEKDGKSMKRGNESIRNESHYSLKRKPSDRTRPCTLQNLRSEDSNEILCDEKDRTELSTYKEGGEVMNVQATKYKTSKKKSTRKSQTIIQGIKEA